ncbi:nodulation protein NfeD [Paenibacillus sp. 1011MAR3C5]|uniref:NfeD family protein n=1 Tax=Paenibacillus sp. 1011MAR3C5 TaxID=1675787 RepID=UPI000E6D37BC|nr:NfeD family protein [Paenibacillus sp. 1011MAR3C5]RJE89880.1 nodulation protein NfeD [Paenibacillus sp. 1011MAR3C5]
MVKQRRIWLHTKTLLLPLMLIAVLTISLTSVMLPAAFASSEETASQGDAGTAVVIVPVKQKVEQGLLSFMERAFKEAQEAKAEHIVLVVNTLGGRVDSASEIGELIRTSPIPTTAFVEGKAVSAGTYIALNANHIAMQPGSTIGAAAVVDGSGTLIEDPKTISFWVGQMTEAAKLNGRDPNIAAAMVDKSVAVDMTDTIGREKKPGEILSLSATDAEKVGYSELTASSVEDVVKWLGLDNRTMIEIQPSLAEEVARFLVNPVVTTILLIIGIAGVAIELLVPGFGAPGIIGLLGFGLFFFGSYVSGLAGMEAMALFIIGIILMVIELFVPSFGILGLLGSASLIAAVVMSAPNPKTGFISLGVAVAAAAVIVALFARTNKGRGIWNKFILRDKLGTEEGYLSADVQNSLVGERGIALTTLRPSGTAQIGDSRVDVVTTGEFIDSGKPVVVIKAEGTWVVVKEVKN